jgi:hypothetical protein
VAKLKKVIQNPESVDPNIITKIGDVKNCNDEVVRHVARQSDMNIGDVEDILNFVGKYTKDVVTAGVMETVMLPYFGKITPNMKVLQGKVSRIRAIQNGSYLLELAVKGKNINFVPQINPINHAKDTPTTSQDDSPPDTEGEMQAPESDLD